MKTLHGFYGLRSALIGCATIALTGCATNNYTQNGALLGGGLGAGTGAIIGHQSGHGEAGALVGGALGAVGGALMGNAQDAWQQRDGALNQLAAASRPMEPPLTDADLVRMSQAGLGDEIIINAVQARGGQFHLHPDGLIALKSSGVSDRVIQFVQTSGGPSPTATVAAPPDVVFIEPRPYVGVHVGPPPLQINVGPPHHHRHHRRPYGFAFGAYRRF